LLLGEIINIILIIKNDRAGRKKKYVLLARGQVEQGTLTEVETSVQLTSLN
jgi:hypothetical protein